MWEVFKVMNFKQLSFTVKMMLLMLAVHSVCSIISVVSCSQSVSGFILLIELMILSVMLVIMLVRISCMTDSHNEAIYHEILDYYKHDDAGDNEDKTDYSSLVIDDNQVK